MPETPVNAGSVANLHLYCDSCGREINFPDQVHADDSFGAVRFAEKKTHWHSVNVWPRGIWFMEAGSLKKGAMSSRQVTFKQLSLLFRGRSFDPGKKIKEKEGYYPDTFDE